MSVYTKNTYNENAPNDAWYKVFGFIEPDSTILDIGCSSGRLGAALKKEKKVHVIGLDIDKDDVELAKKNLDDAFIGNVETDDLSKYGPVDYVVMADVIEHLLDPAAAIAKVKKLLKPGGKLVFSIPNMANVTTRLELLGGHFVYKDFGLLDKTHLHFYDEAEVNRVFNAAGMVVGKMDCTIRNIPDELLKKELSKLGITLTPRLKEVLNQPEAIVYQFIGTAAPGKTPAKLPISTTTELDVISVEMLELREKFEHDIEKSRAEVKRLSKEVERLDKEISEILNSKGWKMLTKVYTAKSKLSGKK